MIYLRRAFRFLFIEPFSWIFYAFFQPQRFQREFVIWFPRRLQRISPLLRLIVPMILTPIPFAISGRAILLLLHLVSLDPANFFFNIAGGIVFGIATFMILSIALGVAFNSPLGFTGGIPIGITFGIVSAIEAHIGGSFPTDFEANVAFGIPFGLALGMILGVVGSNTSVIRGSIAGSIIGAIAGTIALGIPGGIVAGIGGGAAFGLAFIMGTFRLPLYLASGPSAYRAYRASRNNPSKVFDYMHRCSLYWDERPYLPLPYLKRTLLIAYNESPEKALEELAFIAAERPQQLRAARAATLEIAICVLEQCDNLKEIAQTGQQLSDLLPPETKLTDPRWIAPIAHFRDASRDARRANEPIGLQGRRKALVDMHANLRKLSPNAFRDQRLNARLVQVVTQWQEISRQEQEKLNRAAQDIGNIDNPYKPGQYLSLHDSLFVGRRDLAEVLEGTLSLGSRRPTFLLNGERRMGKTSALKLLPSLLGSRYISVFFNLQEPGIYASASAFLGTLADRIQSEMNTRAMPVRPLQFDKLQEAYKTSQPSAYHYFDSWLAGVEDVLEPEQRTLLLAFDEFEILEEAEQAKYLDIRLLLNWMRSIIQFHPRIAMLFSGVKTFDEMSRQAEIDWTSYFINVQILRVSFLKPDEAHHLITKPTPNFPGEDIFPHDVIEMIIAETGCHPFLVQALCSELITLLNVGRREQATHRDVEQAVEKVLEDWGSHFANLWKRTDDDQRTCLEALIDSQHADIQWLAQQTSLDERTVRFTLQKLVKRDLVLRFQDETYRIAVPIFQQWLKTFKPIDVIQATRRGHRVLIPVERETAQSSDVAALPQPAWASPDKARSVLPALLAGSWDEALEGDQNTIAALAGRPYEVVAQDLVRYAQESDPPIRQIGSIWSLASKEDAWRLLARYLTKQDMKRFWDVILDVFGTLDPALDLHIDERWMAGAVGKSRPHSTHLREGLADTLALMASRASDVFLGGTATGQDHATGIVAHLLRKANEDPSGRLWASLSDVLPLLAEAAPDDFLNAVDTASAGADPVICKLFMDTSQVTFAVSSAHTSLLWALERLAWSPDYLGGAALALARLARLDPGGRLANRPGNSLRGIFVFWYPQTTATFEERLHVIDMLREQEPAISWKLMIALLPRPHETADPTDAPRWRGWKPEEREASFTYAELWHATEVLMTRLLVDVGIDSDRICDVVERVENLPPPVRAAVIDYLESLDPAAFDIGRRQAICAELREQIARHRRFSQAQWAMPSQDIDRLRAIYERFKPEDMIQQVSPLFTAWPQLLDEPEEADVKKHEDAVYQAQVAAAQQVYQAEGLRGLLTLIETVEQPDVLGWVLGKSGLVEVEEDHLLHQLGSSDTKRRRMAKEYVAGRFSTCGWEWADEKLDANGPLLMPDQRADFFLRLPSSAQSWARLEHFDDGAADLYWTQFVPWVEDATDCLHAVDQLLAHGRAWQALELLAFYLDPVKPEAEIVMNVFEAALNTPLGTSLSQSLLYNVSQLFTYLEHADDADEGRLARIEWALLPLFRYENRSLKILHSLIATDPEFFVDIVATAYRATDEEPRDLDEQERTRAEAAYHLLQSASIVPGTQDDGTIDPAKLSKWVAETRRLLEERKRLEIGDQCIGHILHHAKQENDELWPPQVIRDLLEKLRSDDIELGLEIAERNARGVTWRNPTAGGEQERQIMNRYLAQARRVQLKWPRTARMLRRIAQAYASEANMNDRDAELREDRW